MVLAMALLLQLLVDPDLVSLRIVNNCIVRCESVYPPELGPEKTILFVPTSGGPNKFSQSVACIVTVSISFCGPVPVVNDTTIPVAPVPV